MTPPKFNVQKVMFIGHEARFYLQAEVDAWLAENVMWIEQRELFDANREVYVEEYRKCQGECRKLREEISALHAARVPSVEHTPSLDTLTIEENT